MAVRLLLLILLIVPSVRAMKVLLIPSPHIASHLLYFTPLGEELLEQGHQVGIVVTPPLRNRVPKGSKGTSMTTHIIPTKRTDEDLTGLLTELGQIQAKGKSVLEMFPIMKALIDIVNEAVADLLDDGSVFQPLKKMKYDVAVVDGSPFLDSLYIVPYILDIPFCSLASNNLNNLMGTPALPSFVPSTASLYTDRMTFLKRLSNFFLIIILEQITTKYNFNEAEGNALIKKYAPNRPAIYHDLKRKTLLWLINQDNLLEFHVPLMENAIQVGGLSIMPNKPLPTELEDFLTKANNDVILVSFGSKSTEVLDPEIIAKLIFVFKAVNQSVIWKYNGNFIDLPSRIKLLKWIPQNDLLAHPKVKLFITHCGSNGQYEALNNGVPMLGLPLFGDQPHNAIRMQSKGYGIAMNVHDLTADQLLHNIKEILANSSYRDNIQKASKIFRSRRSPRKRAFEALDHVVMFGGEHLRPSSVEMPFWQLWMIDIYAFLTLVISVIFFILKIVILFVCRFVTKRFRSKQKVD
ncbi:unnamed protein product [Owenia fusiformis]|uniref:UDP-glucuronosyltransferase n=1 Tax=Owenia fusiformis TaxID=6347 RepID=A0A8S4P039_OWEFU|nr:unnamed protein product [Owenia fusiformis]